MKASTVNVPLRDGNMGAYLAIPDGPPIGAVIAIMEIWGVNETMRTHAKEFVDAGYICLVPDVFWRQEPNVELSDRNPEHVAKAFDLYYDFDYNLAVQDMDQTAEYLKKIVTRITLAGAIFLGLIAILPYLLQYFIGTNSLAIGGTSLLIVVSVVLETVRQVESLMVTRSYEKFLG